MPRPLPGWGPCLCCRTQSSQGCRPCAAGAALAPQRGGESTPRREALCSRPLTAPEPRSLTPQRVLHTTALCCPPAGPQRRDRTGQGPRWGSGSIRWRQGHCANYLCPPYHNPTLSVTNPGPTAAWLCPHLGLPGCALHLRLCGCAPHPAAAWLYPPPQFVWLYIPDSKATWLYPCTQGCLAVPHAPICSCRAVSPNSAAACQVLGPGAHLTSWLICRSRRCLRSSSCSMGLSSGNS